MWCSLRSNVPFGHRSVIKFHLQPCKLILFSKWTYEHIAGAQIKADTWGQFGPTGATEQHSACPPGYSRSGGGTMESTWNNLFVFFLPDHQKLEREARICRLLKHPNIGESSIATHTHKYTHWGLWWIVLRLFIFKTQLCGRQVCVCVVRYLMMMYQCALPAGSSVILLSKLLTRNAHVPPRCASGRAFLPTFSRVHFSLPG